MHAVVMASSGTLWRLLVISLWACDLAAAGDIKMCKAGFTDPQGTYSASYVANNDSVTFTVSGKTTTWVAIGISADTFMANSDIILGAVNPSDPSEFFIHDRYTASRVQPSIDRQQDITDTSVIHEDEETTITFTRQRVTNDTLEDIALDQCVYFLYGLRGPVNNFSDPLSIGQHVGHGISESRYCIPDNCRDTGDDNGGVVNSPVMLATLLFTLGSLVAVVP